MNLFTDNFIYLTFFSFFQNSIFKCVFERKVTTILFIFIMFDHPKDIFVFKICSNELELKKELDEEIAKISISIYLPTYITNCLK